jgi:hypothetical protein
MCLASEIELHALVMQYWLQQYPNCALSGAAIDALLHDPTLAHSLHYLLDRKPSAEIGVLQSGQSIALVVTN